MDLARAQLVPVVLGALALVLACAVVARRRRARAWGALGRGGRPPGDGAGRWFAAVALAGLALAGPRWGAAPGPEGPPGHDVVLLVDVSRSMAATDAVPDRLGAAVAGAQALVEALGRSPGERAAVVAFAGRGVLRCPLTANLGAVRDALSRLRPGDVRPGGTDLAAALAAAREAFPDADPEPGPAAPAPGRAIVVFTDGDDLEGRGASTLAGLRASGIAVHAVTVGDAARPGATVPAPDPASGASRPLEFGGAVVRSRREDATLRAIAGATGGAFLPLGLARPEAVAALADRAIAPAAAARRALAGRAARPERPGAFILAALLAGLAGVAPGWRPRRPAAVAALALLAVGADRPPPTARDASARGLVAFRAGRFAEALSAYEAAIAAAPGAAAPRFNAAVALDRLGRPDAADARYAEALARVGEGDPALRARIFYGRGNAAYRRGDLAAALVHYDACLALPAGDDPGVAAVRRDAAINRAFVARQEAPPPPPSDAPPRGDAPTPPEDRPGEPAPAEPSRSGMASPTPAGTPAPEAADATTEPATPEGQLDRAVDRIRRGRSGPDADAPIPPADPARRDW